MEPGPMAVGAENMSPRRGFTIVDALLLVSVVVVLAAVAVPVVQNVRHDGRVANDTKQIRGIHQGMIVWLPSNNDDYPRPSRFDRQNWSVPVEGKAKDTTANIYSMMIFSKALTPEIFVSPLETNPHVVPCRDYQFDLPKSAVDPANARWDPAFSTVLDGSRPGNASYAHLQPSGDREKRWANTFDAGQPIIGTRGPEIASADRNADGSVTPHLANPSSNTLRFFGRGRAWSGNMAFNDNHVELLKDWIVPGRPFAPTRGTYAASDGTKRADLWFYDEPDDPKAANNYLGIFLKAGDTPADFKATWD